MGSSILDRFLKELPFRWQINSDLSLLTLSAFSLFASDYHPSTPILWMQLTRL
jgi:hypothetical protein